MFDFFFFQAEDGIRYLVRSRGLGDVYKRQSTLLYILSTMDTEYSGQLHIDGQLVTGLPIDSLAEIRNEKIGFVFQFHLSLIHI